MKQSTIEKYLNLLKQVKESGLSVNAFCNQNDLNAKNIYKVIHDIKTSDDTSPAKAELLELYSKITLSTEAIGNVLEEIETDYTARTNVERDSNGRIKLYSYEIFKKDKTPLIGKLSREEMATIYRMYSYYGDSLTRRTISRYFPDFSLVDFKRILKAFNIYKDSAPFPPHFFEEYTEDELREIQLREKENSFLRKAEQDNIKNTEKLLKQYAQENIKLKRKLNDLNSFEVKIPFKIEPVAIPEYTPVGNSINLYLSDLHLGSYTTSGSLFEENNNYGFDEAKRRLAEVLNRLSAFDCFDTVNLVLMGDNIDSCQKTGYTSRMDHIMPNNMDSREQANKYISLMLWFIDSLIANSICSKIRVFSVPCGNHPGEFEYLCNKALMAIIKNRYPAIETTLWESFYGVFEQNGHTYCVCHGKDASFMKRPMPLNLNDKTKVLIYEWLNENGILGNNIHLIKGDLHSNSLSSCKRFDYRNVLSLYGASDYSAYNYSANSYGLSYDLMIGNNLVRGTFENM